MASESKLAMILLIREITNQLDEVAQLRSQGRDASLAIELLREMCAVVRNLRPELQELYFELLPKLAGSSVPNPKNIVTDENALALLAHPRRRMIEGIKADLGL